MSFLLVPKLRLGTHGCETLLRLLPSRRSEAELHDLCSQAELGKKEANAGNWRLWSSTKSSIYRSVLKGSDNHMQGILKVIKKLAPPPKEPQCPKGSWKKVELQIGFKLPPDYKQFIAAYGTGSLQSFMHIWNYLDVPSGTHLPNVIKQITSEYEFDKKAGYPIDFTPYPQSGCLIPFCNTDDGNYLSWRTTGNPSDWCVVAYDCGSGRLIPAEGMNMVKCLIALVQKENPFGNAFCNVEIFAAPVTYTTPMSKN